MGRYAWIINRYPNMLKSAGTAPMRIEQAFRQVVTAAIDKAAQDVREATPVGAGIRLKESTKTQVRTGGGRTPVPQVIGYVYQDARRDGFAYMRAVRFGSRPTPVPYRNLMSWVAKKNRLTSRREIALSAFHLAQHIAKYGIVGYDYVMEPYITLRKQIRPSVVSGVIPTVKSLVR